MASIFRFYQHQLQHKPKLTNALTTGSLFGIGDVIAQVGFPETPNQKFKPERTIRSVIYGSLVFSFVADKWYRILATIKFPGKPLNSPTLDKLRNTIYKMSFDQLLWAPIGIPLYYSVMSIMEQRTPSETMEKLKANWWPTLKANWLVWPAFQVLNFGITPVQHQLLTVNLFSIAWNTYLSMRNAKNQGHTIVHYPPVPE